MVTGQSCRYCQIEIRVIGQRTVTAVWRSRAVSTALAHPSASWPTVILAAQKWCPRQDSNLRSRLRRPVEPRSCLSLMSLRSIFLGPSVMVCCGVLWFIARTLARRACRPRPTHGNPPSVVDFRRSVIRTVLAMMMKVTNPYAQRYALVRPRRAPVRLPRRGRTGH
jgi:hypothetical protein